MNSLSLFLKVLKEKPDEKDQLQKELLKQIQEKSGRKAFAYIVNFKNHPHNMISQEDKSKIVMLIDSVSKEAKDLDFILHSPGGFPEAVEMIVKLIRPRFRNVRFIIPHSAKSGATMLALSGNRILMNDGAELGPIDPQVEGPTSGPAQSIIDGFNEIKKAVEVEKRLNGAYVPLLNKMDVATIKRCETALKYGQALVKDWLQQHMFHEDSQASSKAEGIAKFFSNHNLHLTHARPIFRDEIRAQGVLVDNTEDVDRELANLVWEYYYRFETIFGANLPVTKIFQSESEYIVTLAPVVQIQSPIQVPGPSPQAPQPVKPQKPVP
jgi:ATP-dependent protease ClpP protease subunit